MKNLDAFNRVRQKQILHHLAFNFYLRKGFVPQYVATMLNTIDLAPPDFKFNPDQPRVPAGSPDGGQWTSGGGGGLS